jgi:hypothetical protein
MRRLGRILGVFVIGAGAFLPTANSELQNVDVGGSIEIHGVWYSEYFTPARIVWPSTLLPRRPIGIGGTVSGIGSDGHNTDFVEQRVKLNARADFTRDVSAFIEIDSQWFWGEEFRSDYRTGLDGTGASIPGDPQVYQAYIMADKIAGTPFRLKIGRQELAFGNEWLVGTNSDPDTFTEHSFDALRLTYDSDLWVIDAWASVLTEGGSVAEDDDDVMFYGLYGSFRGIENVQIDAYYLFVRDPRRINDTNFIAPIEWGENILGLDDYDGTRLHTVGMRTVGTIGAFDWYAEAAYQWGDAGTLGNWFRPNGVYGDDDAEYDNWAGVFELGYSFDVRYAPRVFVTGAYYSMNDERDLSFGEWINPFNLPDASVAFNRLFSSQRHNHYIDASANSNYWFLQGGVDLAVTESLELGISALYQEVVEPFDLPLSISVGDFRIPVAPSLSFLTQEGGDDLGVEVAVVATYHYTEDLTFEVGYVHNFVGDALRDGAFFDLNATAFAGGTSDKDAHSVYCLSTLKF